MRQAIARILGPRFLRAAAIGLPLLLAVSQVASADTGSVTYNGCQNLYTGVVRLLPSQLPAPYNTTCNSTTTNKLMLERPISWNQIGPAGLVGPTGATGAQGAQGASGPIGPAGVTGAQGGDGVPGAVGPQGLKGDPGATGPAGPGGSQGPQGLPGPQGPAGPAIVSLDALSGSSCQNGSGVVQIAYGANNTIALLCVQTPSITFLSPNFGVPAGAASVVISGSHFTGVTQVLFGASAAANFTVDSDTQITATTPAHPPGTVDVHLRNGSNQSSPILAADQFQFGNPPYITSVTPSSINSGSTTSVIITGGNFTGATSVAWYFCLASTPCDHLSASFTVDSDTQITATLSVDANGAPYSGVCTFGDPPKPFPCTHYYRGLGDIAVGGPTGESSAVSSDRLTIT